MANTSTIVRFGNLSQYNEKLLAKVTGMLKEVNDQVSAMLEGAPEAYDTLKEIGDYLSAHQDEYTALLTLVGTKADTTALNTHTSDTTAHITAAERNIWNAAKTHADSAHSPADAERNIIVGVKVNGTAVSADADRSVNIPVPVVDEALSETSVNAVQNKAVKAAVDSITTRVTVVENDLSGTITDEDISAMFTA